MNQPTRTVRLKVSPQVARVVGKDAPREVKMEAARGSLPFAGKDLVTCLFFLLHGADGEIRRTARKTLEGLPSSVVRPLVGDPGLQPQLLDFIGRLRLDDPVVMEPLLANPSLPPATLEFVAARAGGKVLDLLVANEQRRQENPRIVAAVVDNPRAPVELKSRLAGGEEGGEEGAEADDGAAEEDENLSKYQQSIEMVVAEKIKMAMTGDKEWRTIFLKDANKMVSTAALRNPRITEGEVLAVAKNRSSNEELIRLINLNREWVKNYEIKKALIYHPKTPLPKALRYMNILGEKDLRALARSRGVSRVLVNNARRLLMARTKK